MADTNNPDIEFLIELVITGQANAQQFEEVMNRIENEPSVAELYRQALAEHRVMEAQVAAAEAALKQEQAMAREAELEQSRQRAEEQRRLEQENDLNLGM